MNLQRWRTMRHSSWTLFLVPLALPLVLICFPGALKQVNRGPAEPGEAAEQVQEPAASPLNLSMAAAGPSEDASDEKPESLFRN